MSNEPKRNVYVGHRYVPKIMGEWDKQETYEGLSIVTYEGASYTSKKRVPVGIDILNEEYWAVTGNYNAQVDYYRSEVQDLQNTVNGEFANINDNLEDINNNLDDSNYYQNIKVSRHFDSTSTTYYYLTEIPKQDSNGDLIQLKQDVFPSNQVTIREYANKHNVTVGTNASWMVGNGLMSGITIKDGVPQPFRELTEEELAYRYILGIKGNNELVSYPGNTNVTDLLNDGVVNATTGFIPLIQNGVSSSEQLLNVFHMGDKHPRQAISQLANGNIVFITTGGRGFEGTGMTAKDIVRIMMGRGAQFSFMLDGGGSASTVVRGVQINSPMDTRGQDERRHANILYVSKPSGAIKRDKDIANIYEQLGNLNSKINTKADKYNILANDQEQLLNGWEGTLYVRMDASGIVHIYGSIVIGTKGVTQSIFATLDETFYPTVNVGGIVTDPNSPWESYAGLVVTSGGTISLRGEANRQFEEGTRIHINLMYKTNY